MANQAEITRLISGLRIKIPNKQPHLRGTHGVGERGRIQNLRPTVASLIMHERIEAFPTRILLAREYTERLISEAVLHGDRHKETMEVAKWWLHSEPGAVHKLFKVLVPRFKDFTVSYTKMFHGPRQIDTERNWNARGMSAGNKIKRSPTVDILELRGNPYPRLAYSNTQPNKKTIHNVLLAEAAKDYYLKKSS